jgi:hypothetical protein
LIRIDVRAVHRRHESGMGGKGGHEILPISIS